MLDVICWKWKPKPGYRSKFQSSHVNVLKSMVGRNYSKPFRFSCITDDPRGLDPSIRPLPLSSALTHLKNPSFHNGPNCYPRLWAFSEEAKEAIGPRFVSMDIDVVITGSLDPILDRKEDFIIWGDTAPSTWYNGSLWMMTAGARKQVWDDFDPNRSPQEANASGQRGSDQGWISYKLGPNEATWTDKDGIYSFRNHIMRRPRYSLPENAKVVVFHGAHDPWDRKAQRQSWVKKNWC